MNDNRTTIRMNAKKSLANLRTSKLKIRMDITTLDMVIAFLYKDSVLRTRKALSNIDKLFKNADGDEAMYPGGFGIASEDINCRCCVVQRAKWNLNNKFTKMNGETNKLMEFKNKEDYNKFKAEFWKWSDKK